MADQRLPPDRELRVEPTRLPGPRGGRARALVAGAIVVGIIVVGLGLATLGSPPTPSPDQALRSEGSPQSRSSPSPGPSTTRPSPDSSPAVAFDWPALPDPVTLDPAELEAGVVNGGLDGSLVFLSARLVAQQQLCGQSFAIDCLVAVVPGLDIPIDLAPALVYWEAPPPGSVLVMRPQAGRLVYLGVIRPGDPVSSMRGLLAGRPTRPFPMTLALVGGSAVDRSSRPVHAGARRDALSRVAAVPGRRPAAPQRDRDLGPWRDGGAGGRCRRAGRWNDPAGGHVPRAPRVPPGVWRGPVTMPHRDAGLGCGRATRGRAALPGRGSVAEVESGLWSPGWGVRLGLPQDGTTAAPAQARGAADPGDRGLALEFGADDHPQADPRDRRASRDRRAHRGAVPRERRPAQTVISCSRAVAIPMPTWRSSRCSRIRPRRASCAASGRPNGATTAVPARGPRCRPDDGWRDPRLRDGPPAGHPCHLRRGGGQRRRTGPGASSGAGS